MSQAAPAPAPVATAPAAAPAANPADLTAPVVPAPAAEPTAAKPDFTAPPAPPITDPGDVIVEYNPTGDAGLDLALQFVGNLGYGPERPEIVAATKGDFAPLEAALKARGDKAKGFERYLTAAKDSFARSSAKSKAAEDASEKAIVAAAGGVAAWNEIHAWVVAEADDEQKAEITRAFKAGPMAASAMAQQLAALYKQTGKSTIPAKSAVKPGASAAASEADGAISAQQFKDGVRELTKKYGNRLDEAAEYKALAARRQAGLRAGK